MRRRPNTLPTTIYWLIDTRPETREQCRSLGRPFYCGKTIDNVEKRLKAHRDAAKVHPHRTISQWLKACGPHVSVHIVATVPAGGDWSAAERRWIEVIHYHFPGGANMNTGGQGSPGLIMSAEARAKISAAHKGKTVSAETRALIGAASKGRKHSPESVERGAVKKRGQKRSAETRARIGAASLLRWAEARGLSGSKRDRALRRAELAQQRQSVNA